MKLINYIPSITNIEEYYDEIKNSMYDGIFINTVLETDYVIKVYIPNINKFFNLLDFLETFKEYKKPIIINMLLGYIFLNENNSQEIARLNHYYVNKIKEILKKYPNNIFNISTLNDSILYFLKTTHIPYEIGIIIIKDNLNFKDVNFYIFTENHINLEIVNMLLFHNKKIMVFPDKSNNLKNFPKNILDNLYYIVSNTE